MTYYSPTDPTQQVPVTPAAPAAPTPDPGPSPTPAAGYPAQPGGGYPTYPATPSGGYPVLPATPAAPAAPAAPPTAQYPYPTAGPAAYPGAAPYVPGAAPYVPLAAPASSSRANVAGIVVTAAGVLLVLLGVWLPWYAQGSQHVKLADILRVAKAPGAKGLPHFYFGTGIWLVIVVTVALCLLANMGFAATALRIVGPLVALLGAALVLASLNSLRDGHGSIFDHASIGLFLVLLGFVVAAVGGVLGDRPGPRTG